MNRESATGLSAVGGDREGRGSALRFFMAKSPGGRRLLRFGDSGGQKSGADRGSESRKWEATMGMFAA